MSWMFLFVIFWLLASGCRATDDQMWATERLPLMWHVGASESDESIEVRQRIFAAVRALGAFPAHVDVDGDAAEVIIVYFPNTTSRSMAIVKMAAVSEGSPLLAVLRGPPPYPHDQPDPTIAPAITHTPSLALIMRVAPSLTGTRTAVGRLPLTAVEADPPTGVLWRVVLLTSVALVACAAAVAAVGVAYVLRRPFSPHIPSWDDCGDHSILPSEETSSIPRSIPLAPRCFGASAAHNAKGVQVDDIYHAHDLAVYHGGPRRAVGRYGGGMVGATHAFPLSTTSHGGSDGALHMLC